MFCFYYTADFGKIKSFFKKIEKMFEFCLAVFGFSFVVIIILQAMTYKRDNAVAKTKNTAVFPKNSGVFYVDDQPKVMA